MTDFRSKQIEKLQAAISKLEGKSGEAVERARKKYEGRISDLEHKQSEACIDAAKKFQQKIDALEKQLKALGA